MPEEHVLVRVDRVLDLVWLPGAVADNGRPGIDSEASLPPVVPFERNSVQSCAVSGKGYAYPRGHG